MTIDARAPHRSIKLSAALCFRATTPTTTTASGQRDRLAVTRIIVTVPPTSPPLVHAEVLCNLPPPCAVRSPRTATRLAKDPRGLATDRHPPSQEYTKYEFIFTSPPRSVLLKLRNNSGMLLWISRQRCIFSQTATVLPPFRSSPVPTYL